MRMNVFKDSVCTVFSVTNFSLSALDGLVIELCGLRENTVKANLTI